MIDWNEFFSIKSFFARIKYALKTSTIKSALMPYVIFPVCGVLTCVTPVIGVLLTLLCSALAAAMTLSVLIASIKHSDNYEQRSSHKKTTPEENGSEISHTVNSKNKRVKEEVITESKNTINSDREDKRLGDKLVHGAEEAGKIAATIINAPTAIANTADDMVHFSKEAYKSTTESMNKRRERGDSEDKVPVLTLMDATVALKENEIELLYNRIQEGCYKGGVSMVSAINDTFAEYFSNYKLEGIDMSVRLNILSKALMRPNPFQPKTKGNNEEQREKVKWLIKSFEAEDSISGKKALEEIGASGKELISIQRQAYIEIERYNEYSRFYKEPISDNIPFKVKSEVIEALKGTNVNYSEIMQNVLGYKAKDKEYENLVILENISGFKVDEVDRIPILIKALQIDGTTTYDAIQILNNHNVEVDDKEDINNIINLLRTCI